MRWQDDGWTVHLWVDVVEAKDVRLDVKGTRLELRVGDHVACEGTLYAGVGAADWDCDAGSVHVQLRKTTQATWPRCFAPKKKKRRAPRFKETILDPDASPAPPPSNGMTFYGVPVCDAQGRWSVVSPDSAAVASAG